ncbi:pathogenesis-related gene 1 [Euphorbia peplus]|nr:pathogenesis-related gene 1 [Euphorbia peplus]
MKIELFNSSSLYLLSFVFILLPLLSFSQNTPQDYLVVHNEARTSVGVGNLQWNNSLAVYALNFSKKRIGDCNIINSEGPYGENIAWSSNADFQGMDAVKLWVDEGSNYDQDTKRCEPGKVCTHYIQVVWRKTQQLGCAKVRCTGGGSLVTCSYNPRGNVPGEVPY